MYLKKCKVCGKEFGTDNQQEQMCSEECKQERKREIARDFAKRNREIEKIVESNIEKHCAYCGKVFHSPTKRKKYCCNLCMRSAHQEKSAVAKDRRREKPAKSLTEIAREAKEHGMSYGSYVVWLEGRAQ